MKIDTTESTMDDFEHLPARPLHMTRFQPGDRVTHEERPDHGTVIDPVIDNDDEHHCEHISYMVAWDEPDLDENGESLVDLHCGTELTKDPNS